MQAPVSVDVSGLSVRDLVIVNARHRCYVNFTKTVFGTLKRLTRFAPLFETFYKKDYDSLARVLISNATGELAGCLALADLLEQQLKAPAAAHLAAASCAVTPVTLSFTGSGRKARLRSIRGDTHPPLKVSCIPTSGGIRITVSTRSNAALSSVVRSRLRLTLARSKKDFRGGQLSATFHHS